MIKFLASKYQQDTGRAISLPSSLGYILQDPSILGTSELIRDEDEQFDKNLKHGRIAAETLDKPMTFFEAVEALRLPKDVQDLGDKKKGADKKKDIESLKFEDHHFISHIDLGGFRNLRFSRAGL